MPNHTSNKLTVNGPSDAVTRFKLANAGKEEPLSLEKALPTPPELLGDNSIVDGSVVITLALRMSSSVVT